MGGGGPWGVGGDLGVPMSCGLLARLPPCCGAAVAACGAVQPAKRLRFTLRSAPCHPFRLTPTLLVPSTPPRPCPTVARQMQEQQLRARQLFNSTMAAAFPDMAQPGAWGVGLYCGWDGLG